jgi:hypothetical protein
MGDPRIIGSILLLLAACGGIGEDASPDPGASILQVQERGPVTVTLEVTPKEVSIADRITFRIRAKAPPEVDVTLPEFGESLGAFSVRDFRTFPNGREYVLDSLLSGEYPIPSMTVRFVDNRPDAEHPGKEHEIVTDELKIQVESLVPGDPRLADIRDIPEPVSFPEEDGGMPLWPIGAGILALGITLLVVLRRRKATVRARHAHEIAYAELEALVAADLVGKGEYGEFYFRLSGALRRYIEARFRLRAPERTTEEFLREIASNGDALDPHREPLREFLEHADLVKFARHRPETKDIENSFDFARDFIEKTRIREERSR